MTGIPKPYIPGYNEYVRVGKRLTKLESAFGTLTVLPHGDKSEWNKDKTKEKAAREAKWSRDFQREENRKLIECAIICFAALGFMAWIVWA